MAERVSPPDLDNPQVYEEHDPAGAYNRLFDMADQCRRAWEIAMAWSPPPLPVSPRAVVSAGMGGSAIGGDLLCALAAPLATVPLLVQRDYGLPGYFGPHTLILACSYSGNTEETLSVAKEARERGVPLVVITTGGRLAELSHEWGISPLTFVYPAQPRETLGYGLLLPLGALTRMDLLPDLTPDVEEAIVVLERLQEEIASSVPLARNPAKELAHWLYGCLPFVCGAGLLAPVARRWKGQFNENSKSWAVCEELPEMDHNAVAGMANPAGFARQVRAIFLTSDHDHPRNRVRQEVTRRLYEEAGTPCRTVAARGKSPLTQVLSSALLGDASSYYLAMLYRADPTAIPAIKSLKEALARAPW